MGQHIREPAFGVAAFASKNADSAGERFHSAYGPDARIGTLNRDPAFALQFTRVAFGRTVISKLDASNCKMIRQTGEHVHITVFLRGATFVKAGSRRRDISGPTVFVTRPRDLVEIGIPRGLGIALYVPVDRLQECAERMTGGTHSTNMLQSMVDTVDLNSPTGASLARTTQTALAEMTALNAVNMGSIAASAYEELLVNLAAASLFPVVTNNLEISQADCGPAIIRQARDFIKEHSSEVVEISKLASDLGISMRALQVNFRRYFSFSPRDYLVECRLDDARRKLQSDHGRLSVTDIAIQSGFSDLSHFAAKYRDKFGELPSETLKAARRV